jgi:hypothetical protein
MLAFLLAAVPVSNALAAPGDPDPEGGTAALRDQLEAASKGYTEAQERLEQSQQRQAELTRQLADADVRIAQLTERAGVIAVSAYRTGGLRTASVLLGSGSADAFVDRVTTINLIAMDNDRRLRELSRLRREHADRKAAIDAEIRTQQQQLAIMAKKKEDAENALASYVEPEEPSPPPPSPIPSPTPSPTPTKASPNPTPTKANPNPTRTNPGSGTAKPGPGPGGGCTVNDPTTTGCITARTLHALQQAKGAGFTRFVSCYRPGGAGEHPKGRACDFAAQKDGFGGVATGGDRTYGDNLANYYINNARPLAVLYVIWFKRIWHPATGWRPYRHGRGDPSSDHTNHVHLSVAA